MRWAAIPPPPFCVSVHSAAPQCNAMKKICSSETAKLAHAGFRCKWHGNRAGPCGYYHFPRSSWWGKQRRGGGGWGGGFVAKNFVWLFCEDPPVEGVYSPLFFFLTFTLRLASFQVVASAAHIRPGLVFTGLFTSLLPAKLGRLASFAGSIILVERADGEINGFARGPGKERGVSSRSLWSHQLP